MGSGSLMEVEPGPPTLGVQSLSHWTTREVPGLSVFKSWWNVPVLPVVTLGGRGVGGVYILSDQNFETFFFFYHILLRKVQFY